MLNRSTQQKTVDVGFDDSHPLGSQLGDVRKKTTRIISVTTIQRATFLVCSLALINEAIVPHFNAPNNTRNLERASGEVRLPWIYKGFKDVSDPRESVSDDDGKDAPVFWHIHKSGGSTMKEIFGACYRMCMAHCVPGLDHETEIAKLPNANYVNVDLTTSRGIQRAKDLGLAQSGIAQVMVTPEVYQVASIFDESYRGKVFALFRHPIDRFVSEFNYLSYATWERTYDPLKANVTLEEYARSDLGEESNWMVRRITNLKRTEVGQGHLKIAKEFIRKKVLVGLMTEMEESVERFDKFFQWRYTVNPENQEKCRKDLVSKGTNVNTAKKVEKPQPGSVVYDLLMKQFDLDIELYEYAVSIFNEQKKWFEDIPDGYRLVNATCCKCYPATC